MPIEKEEAAKKNEKSAVVYDLLCQAAVHREEKKALGKNTCTVEKACESVKQ